MCRWFCMVSQEHCLIEDMLVRPKHSLLKQIDEHYLPDVHIQYQPSDDSSTPNVTTNMDGFGVAYWTTAAVEFDPHQQGVGGDATRLVHRDSMRPVMYKSIRPALNDLNLQSLASGTSSKGLLAHIRAGTGLTPVVQTNNHPFLFGRYAFAHNGVLSHFSSLKIRLLSSLRLPKARAAILGTTDTEHMAALFFERLVGGTQAGWADLIAGKRYSVETLAATMRTILTELEGWIAQCLEEERLAGMAQTDTCHSALNLVVTDGSQMVSIRYASPPPREPPSLYLSTTAGATLNRLYEGNPDLGHPVLTAKGHHFQQGRKPRSEHSRHVIVASEPSTYDASEWRLIPAQHMVMVGDDYIPQVVPI